MRTEFHRWILALVLVACHASVAGAQMRAVHVPTALPVDRPVVLYMQLVSAPDAEALALAAPAHVEVVSLQRKGDTGWMNVRLQPMRDRPGRYAVGEAEPGLYALTIVSRASTDARTLTVSTVGSTQGVTLRIALPGSVPVPSTDYRHFRVTPDTAPVVATAARLPATVEFWIRTVSRDQVVVSTWSGREGEAYPLDVVLDTDGFVEVFRGDGTRHGSVRSRVPVADGLWHHVAVTTRDWVKLVVDGTPQDSLLARMLPVPTDTPQRLSFGRRPGARTGSFRGDLDEVRLWDEVRPASTLRARMLQHTRTLDKAPQWSASFETETPDHVPSDLLLYRPPSDIRVLFDPAGARLSWSASERRIRLFRVERRIGSGPFEVVGELPAGEGSSWSWLDAESEPGIRYYRIRQIHRDGASVASAPVKVGFGELPSTEALSVQITGNYPNPFRPRTTIAFEVREPVHVRLTVWDLSGQLIRVLVDGALAAGTHEVPFDGDGLPSGAYFARVEAGGRTQTHQMVLTK